MKKNEENVKNKISGKKIFGKCIAAFMLVAMVLGSCSTCIYFVIAAINN